MMVITEIDRSLRGRDHQGDDCAEHPDDSREDRED